jgi:sarcosine oxidase subunit beta
LGPPAPSPAGGPAIADLPRTAPVVVVGGGVVGASTLHHLAAAGCRGAVLVERDTLGSGSTGAAAGGIRAQFSDELNVRIARECLARFARFGDEVGGEIGFRRTGYLFLLRDHEVAAFAASVALQRRLGVATEVVDPAEAARHVPGLRTDDLAAATYNPDDGGADPGAVVQAYADSARRRGARVVQGVEALRVVTSADADGGPGAGADAAARSGGRGAPARVVGVETTAGTIATPVVVCAAGVWSRPLAATVGVDLPVRGERRYVYLTGPVDPGAWPAVLPLTIDFATGFYLHREGPGLLLGGPWDRPDDLAPVALHRLPSLSELTIRPAWSGLYEMSPDHNAVVGAAASPAGFLYATGFSGHGFQQAPVVGDHLAALALGLPPTLDLSPFSVERFAGATGRPEGHVV